MRGESDRTGEPVTSYGTRVCDFIKLDEFNQLVSKLSGFNTKLYEH